VRIETKARELAEPFGGWSKLDVLDRTRLEQASELLARKARTHEDAVRAANTVRGLLASVERRRGRHEAHSADFASLLPDGAP